MTPEQRHRAAIFARDPHLCALAFLGGCSGQLQADHVLKKAWLCEEWERARRRGERLGMAVLDQLIADGDNGWILCERHHGLKDRRLLTVYREWLPGHVKSFALRWGITWKIERDFPTGGDRSLRAHGSPPDTRSDPSGHRSPRTG